MMLGLRMFKLFNLTHLDDNGCITWLYVCRGRLYVDGRSYSYDTGIKLHKIQTGVMARCPFQ